MESPLGLQTEAALEGPPSPDGEQKKPQRPAYVPLMVVRTLRMPSGPTRKTTLLAIYRLPAASTATAEGREIAAEVAWSPSVRRHGLPPAATVRIPPSKGTLRT